MLRVIFSALIFFAISTLAHATTPTGIIKEVIFHGSGASETMFVAIEPKSSACPSTGKYMMLSKDRPGMTASLLAAFHAQTTVTIYGTGQCHTAWTGYEVLDYAAFSK